MPKKDLKTGDLFEILIYVLFASALIPIIASQMTTLEGDSDNFSASEIVLLGLVTLLIVLGTVYAVYRKMLA